jgi:hypothetical protein
VSACLSWRLAGRWLGRLTLLLLLAGCASLTPVQETRLSDLRDRVARVTSHFGVARVYIRVGDTGVEHATGRIMAGGVPAPEVEPPPSRWLRENP